MATQKCVAFLRGVNVGTAKRVAMAQLRALAEDLGYTDVRTLLNSGNVVFEAAKEELGKASARIEKALKSKLGVSARVTVMSAEELSHAMRANPLGKVADNPSRLLVGILADPADRANLDEISGKDWGREKIVLGKDRAVYMWMPQGVIESKLSAAVSKALGDRITSRNWATMLKLNEMAEEGQGEER